MDTKDYNNEKVLANRHYNIGWIFYREDKYDKAIEEFKKSIIHYESYLGRYHDDIKWAYLMLAESYYYLYKEEEEENQNNNNNIVCYKQNSSCSLPYYTAERIYAYLNKFDNIPLFHRNWYYYIQQQEEEEEEGTDVSIDFEVVEDNLSEFLKDSQSTIITTDNNQMKQQKQQQQQQHHHHHYDYDELKNHLKRITQLEQDGDKYRKQGYFEAAIHKYKQSIELEIKFGKNETCESCSKTSSICKCYFDDYDNNNNNSNNNGMNNDYHHNSTIISLTYLYRKILQIEFILTLVQNYYYYYYHNYNPACHNNNNNNNNNNNTSNNNKNCEENNHTQHIQLAFNFWFHMDLIMDTSRRNDTSNDDDDDDDDIQSILLQQLFQCVKNRFYRFGSSTGGTTGRLLFVTTDSITLIQNLIQGLSIWKSIQIGDEYHRKYNHRKVLDSYSTMFSSLQRSGFCHTHNNDEDDDDDDDDDNIVIKDNIPFHEMTNKKNNKDDRLTTKNVPHNNSCRVLPESSSSSSSSEIVQDDKLVVISRPLELLLLTENIHSSV